MLFTTVLFCQFLLSASAISIRSKHEHLATHLGRRVEVDVVRSEPRYQQYQWPYAGAVLNSTDESYEAATATFTVPSCSVPENGDKSLEYFVDAVIGIDVFGCDNALRVGVACIATGNKVFHSAWYEWLPDYTRPRPLSSMSVIPITAGDVVSLTASAVEATKASVYFDNLTTGKQFARVLYSGHKLCRKNAAWLVLFDPVETKNTRFASFDNITFSHARAISTENGNVTVGLSNAQIVEFIPTELSISSFVSNSSVTVETK